MKPPLARQCVAELIGTFALIFIGIGAIHHLGAIASPPIGSGLGCSRKCT
jgi:glycerol uptake facilitator-like aquaporin